MKDQHEDHGDVVVVEGTTAQEILANLPAATENQKTREVLPKFHGKIGLKNFHSIIVRMAKEGDVDLKGNQIPLDQEVFCLKGAANEHVDNNDLKAMALLYLKEEDKTPEEKGMLIALKEPKIRYKPNAARDPKNLYKQHTVIVGYNGEGIVGYWESALTEDDHKVLAERAEKQKAEREVKAQEKAARKVEKERLALEKAKAQEAKASVVDVPLPDASAEVNDTPTAEVNDTPTAEVTENGTSKKKADKKK